MALLDSNLNESSDKDVLVAMVLDRVAKDMLGENVPEEFIEWLETLPNDKLLELIPSDHPIIKGGTGKSSTLNFMSLPSLTDIMENDPHYLYSNPIFNSLN